MHDARRNTAIGHGFDSAGIEFSPQECPRSRFMTLCHLFGCPFGNDPAPVVPASGTQVDHPIRCLDHIEVMLNHDDRVAFVHKLVQHRKQQADIFEMKSRGGLIEYVERVPRPHF